LFGRASLRIAGAAPQIWAVIRLVHVVAILVVVGHALPDELLAPVRYAGLLRESHIASIEDRLVPHDGHLRLVVAEWLHTEEQLEKDYTHAPNINLKKDDYVRNLLVMGVCTYLLGNQWHF
jgi:hypothetical protein